MSPRTAICLTVVMTLTVTAPVMAGQGTGKLPKLDAVDANGDGVVSLEEAREAGADPDRFRRTDLDDDGNLTPFAYRYSLRDLGAKTGGPGD